jgi:DNA replication protein DnaC
MHRFQTRSQYEDEWSMLQYHVDEFSKMHMNDSSIDIPLLVAMKDLNNRSKCFISTNIEGIEPYDLSTKKIEQRDRKKNGNKNAYNCPDGIVSNNEFASSNLLFIFITGGAGTGKTFTSLCIIQYLLQYYNKINLEADLLKQKIVKLGYIGKAAFNIGGSIIHSILGIPLNKSLLELEGLSDERRDSFAKRYNQLRL